MTDPYNIPVKNTTNAAIPPFAVMSPTGIVSRNGQWVYEVGKPGTTSRRLWLVNGRREIKKGGYGRAADGVTTPVLVRTTNTGSPAFGKQYGTQNNSWSLSDTSVGAAGNFEWLAGSGFHKKLGSVYLALFRQAECNELLVTNSGSFTSGVATASTAGGHTISIHDYQFPEGPWWDTTGLVFKVAFVNGLWRIDGFEECPPEE